MLDNIYCVFYEIELFDEVDYFDDILKAKIDLRKDFEYVNGKIIISTIKSLNGDGDERMKDLFVDINAYPRKLKRPRNHYFRSILINMYDDEDTGKSYDDGKTYTRKEIVDGNNKDLSLVSQFIGDNVTLNDEEINDINLITCHPLLQNKIKKCSWVYKIEH